MLSKEKVLEAVSDLFRAAEENEEVTRICTVNVSNEGLEVLSWIGDNLEMTEVKLDLRGEN